MKWCNAAIVLVMSFGCVQHKEDIQALEFARMVRSANGDAWLGNVMRDSSLVNNQAYMMSRQFFEKAATIEMNRHRWEDSVSSSRMLNIEQLRVTATRRHNLQLLAAFEVHEAAATEALKTLVVDYRSWLKDTLSSFDSASSVNLFKALIQPEFFVPQDRLRYGELQRSTLIKYRELLLLIDSGLRSGGKFSIQFDSVIRFREPLLSSRYTLLRFEIDSLAKAERRLFGLPGGTQESSSSDRDMVP